MNNPKEVKGTTPAKVAGGLICFYGAIMFIVSLFIMKSIDITVIIILLISSAAIIIGIGLLRLNYHAWFAAVVLTALIVVLSGIALTLIFFVGESGNPSPMASNLLLQVLFFWLIYSGREACKVPKEKKTLFPDFSDIFFGIKTNFAVLAGVAVTVTTLIVVKYYNALGFLIFGFPLVIIEFAIFYLLGQKIQKKFNW